MFLFRVSIRGRAAGQRLCMRPPYLTHELHMLQQLLLPPLTSPAQRCVACWLSLLLLLLPSVLWPQVMLTSMSSTTSAKTTLNTSVMRFTLRGLKENLPLSFLDRCTSTGCRPAEHNTR